MNEQLIKLIELCLIDGVISDKERRVIFTKSEELGISKDECEIILEGMIQKHSKKNTSQPQKKKGFFGSIMDEVKKGVDEVKKNIDVDSITDKVNSFREEYEKKVEESRTKTSSIVQEEKPQSNTTSSEGIKDEEKVEDVRTESSSTVQEELLEEKEILELEKKQKEENEIKWKKQRIERENREKIERENKELSEKEKTQTEKEKQKSKEKYLKFIKELDEDGNGIIDVVQSDDFSNILKKNQEKIIEINREYIKQFVQVSSYLNTKRKSLQSVFENLLKTVNEGGTYTSLYELIDFNSYSNNLVTLVKEVKKVTGLGLTESKQIVEDYFRGEGELNKKNKYFKSINEESYNRYFEILKEDIHLFNILLLLSLNMVDSLVNNDIISFYEIYEKFDQMNMFDSKHEKDIKEHLKNINNNIEDVMSEIKIMGEQIISSLGDLNSSIDELIYSTQESNERIVEGLESVNSSIDVNNLISSIQTYQLYKINKNTRGL